MGRSLQACLAYGVVPPEFVEDIYGLVETAKDAVLEKHGKPPYFHQNNARPPRAEFEDYDAWKEHVDQLEKVWHESTEPGRKRKAFEDEWASIGIGTAIAGVDGYLIYCLVDEETKITANYEPQRNASLPETPKNFKERLELLFELAGVEYRLKQEPSWLLLASYW